MASENGRQPIPPEKRRRLQQCFERGNQCIAKGDHEYATTMFTPCVLGDPGNVIYVQNLLKNLQQMHKNNKKGVKFASARGAGTKASVKKASMSKDWLGVIKSGIEMLKLNPWDSSTLTAMAAACEQLDMDEAAITYLLAALDAEPKDVQLNRLAGRVLARMGQFDRARSHWLRVQQGKPGDEEAGRAIADLAIEKTISHGGYEQAESSTDVMTDKDAQSERYGHTAALTREQQLEKLIGKNPSDLGNYMELADYHYQNERYKEAEGVLERALQVSGSDITLRERLEDTQLRRARQELLVAEKQAKDTNTEAAINLAKKMKAEFNKLELEIYRTRSERYPTNTGYKFELGVRLKRAGNINEAIGVLQEARSDGKRKAAVHLELGECFQHVKRYDLAMQMYDHALAASSERDPEQRKLILYRAAVLAMGIGERDKSAESLQKAHKYLTDVAGIDFNYKDVPQRLDKLAKLRDKL